MPLLYQREWNGIDLAEVATDSSLLDHGTPNAAFYAEYYRRLRAGGNSFPSGWWETKKKNSGLLVGWVDAAARALGRDPRELAILSVGAGLGVVELPLLESGYRITLHEVQDESLQYARDSAGARGLKLDTVTGPLGSLGRRFDFVYLGSCEYCLPEEHQYTTFLAEVRERLTDKGRVVALDYTPGLRNYVAAWTAPFRPSPGVRWGRLRSAAERSQAFDRAGLRVISYQLYDPELVLLTAGDGGAKGQIPGRGGVAVLHASRRS